MKKHVYLGGAAGLALAAGAALVALPRSSHAADHADADSLATNKAADITDVYAWMTADHTKVNLVMDVSPNTQAGDHFGTNILYAFHVQATSKYGATPTIAPTIIICQFASDTSVQCWVGNSEYVTGDPSNTAGITSADGKVKVYAGVRNDPFFFNLHGFKHVAAQVAAAAAGLGPLSDGHGCFDLHAAGPSGSNLGAILAGQLGKDTDGTTTGSDTFAGLNVLSIVLQVDATLVAPSGNPVIGVWASTNTKG